MNEVRILGSIESSFIVRINEAFVNQSETQFWIVMEYMGGGDLANKIYYAKKNLVRIPEKEIWKYLIQILIGLRDLN